MATFPVSARTFNAGNNVFGPTAIPVGTHKGTLTLDVAAMGTPEARTVPGQSFNLIVDYSPDGGVTWLNLGSAPMEGPWRDKQGILHNDVSVSFDFGSTSVDNGPWVPRVSAAGWQVRAAIVVNVGAINTAGGTLELT
jgi:hypothetical protein